MATSNTTPKPAQKATPVKATAPAAFSLESLPEATTAPAPRRNDDSTGQVSEKVMSALRASWENRKELTKARDAVPAKDGKPAQAAVKATELGDGRAFEKLPENAVKIVEGQIRKGAANLGLGVSVRTTKNQDNTYTVRFAAKTLKQGRRKASNS